MTRFIISFYLMLFLSLGIFLFSFFGSMSIALPNPFIEGINQKMAKGTLTLLNEAFKGLDVPQTKSLLDHYRKTFGKDLSLLDETAIAHFSTEQRKLINKGEMVFESIANPVFIEKKDYPSPDGENIYLFYYLKQSESEKIWRIHVDIDGGGFSFPIDNSNDQDFPKITRSEFIAGTMSLIQSFLTADKQHDWQAKLQKIEKQFGLPIRLIPVSKIKLKYVNGKKNPLSREIQNKTYIYFEDDNSQSFIQRIQDSNWVLQLGPFQLSWFTRHINTLLIVAALLGLLSTFLLWLWPLWSNLIKIKKAADMFGKGDYSTRIPESRFSPIKSISSAFNAMAQQTENSIRSHKELTSAVSHELRTPLSRMHFALETLEDNNHKYSLDEKNNSIIDIKEDINELNLLVDELLTYSRLDQKDAFLKPASVNLTSWMNDSMDKLQPLTANKTLAYQILGIQQNETCLMDAHLMTRLLNNLVQNALRYAKHKVLVCLQKEQNGYLLVVEDDGVGIPKDKQQQVFEAFTRIDGSRNRRNGGYGLGLAIVDKIIKAHGGNVKIAQSDRGACFKVRFPKA